MEWNEETYMANTLDKLDELESLQGKLYAGYILAMDKGHIRAEVYKKGHRYVCFVYHSVPYCTPRWVRSGKCYAAQESIVDALAKAGYDCDKCHYGWDALRQIGQEFGDNFRLYTFGNF